MMYTASEEDMREYARLVSVIASLDLQRNQAVQALGAWEEAHRVADDPAEESEEAAENQL